MEGLEGWQVVEKLFEVFLFVLRIAPEPNRRRGFELIEFRDSNCVFNR